jgi:7-carboxy-7-deazaguanine synthase
MNRAVLELDPNARKQPSLLLSADGVFATIQGEGPATGRPATFIRLAGCNLACGTKGGKWQCDTPYTWDWAGQLGTKYSTSTEVKRVAARDVLEAVWGTRPRLVVVTGGEPLLQDRALVSMLYPLHAAGVEIHVETNGTRWPEYCQMLVDLFVVSPKLSSSGNPDAARKIDPRWMMSPRAVFKFVVADPERDVPEIGRMLGTSLSSLCNVWLMPAGTTPEEIIEGQKRLVPVCLRFGFQLGSRQHILWFGNERGT